MWQLEEPGRIFLDDHAYCGVENPYPVWRLGEIVDWLAENCIHGELKLHEAHLDADHDHQHHHKFDGTEWPGYTEWIPEYV